MLGRGSIASVYSATDPKTGEPVAVKVMDRYTDSEAFRTRFEREAEIAQRIDHKHACRGYGYGVLEGGVPWLMMERLDGEDLSGRFEREPPMTVGTLLAVGYQVSQALSAAHGVGLIHRDVKPGNIFLVKGDDPKAPRVAKLLDFGMSVFYEDGPGMGRLTQTGEILGTPDYMAPEQARGGRHSGPPVDVYGLAAVIYHLLAGTPPHGQGTAMEVITRKLEKTAVPLQSFRPELPGTVLAAVEAGLARHPDDRPNMEAFRSLLTVAHGSVRGSGDRVAGPSAAPGIVARAPTMLVAVGFEKLTRVMHAIGKHGGKTHPLGSGRLVAFFESAPEAGDARAAVTAARAVADQCSHVCVLTLPNVRGSRGDKIKAAVTESERLGLTDGEVRIDDTTRARLERAGHRV
ncbi:MAG: hypothetical protein ACI9WU_004745 [Myxococcota bacterium]